MVISVPQTITSWLIFENILFRKKVKSEKTETDFADTIHIVHMINQFLANVTILHPLKTTESLWFSDVF